MTLWDFLATHPWWGLIYLLLICVTVLACVAGFATRKDEKKEHKNESGPRPLMG